MCLAYSETCWLIFTHRYIYPESGALSCKNFAHNEIEVNLAPLFSLRFLCSTWTGSSLICHANAPVTLIHMPFELRENSNCYLGFEETHQQFKIRCLLNIFKWNVETSVQGTSICQRNQKSSLAA